MSMARLAKVVGLLLVGAMVVHCGSTGGGGDSPCDQAARDYANKTAHLGQSCDAGSVTGCDKTYDNCIEGSCHWSDSADDMVCAQTCSGDYDCCAQYCVDGVCQGACQSHTYCDGVLCCFYYPDPSNPTQCKQGSCY
jgi:hypothetical protein